MLLSPNAHILISRYKASLSRKTNPCTKCDKSIIGPFGGGKRYIFSEKEQIPNRPSGQKNQETKTQNDRILSLLLWSNVPTAVNFRLPFSFLCSNMAKGRVVIFPKTMKEVEQYPTQTALRSASDHQLRSGQRNSERYEID